MTCMVHILYDRSPSLLRVFQGIQLQNLLHKSIITIHTVFFFWKCQLQYSSLYIEVYGGGGTLPFCYKREILLESMSNHNKHMGNT